MNTHPTYRISQVIAASDEYTAPIFRGAEGDATVAQFDAAVAAELPRVSHVEYDSHEICKHFAGKVRERLAAIAATAATGEPS